MKTPKIFLSVILILLLGFTSCKKKHQTVYPNIKEGTLNLGSNLKTNFFIRIINEDGQAVENASIIVGNKSGTTDENGVFMVKDVVVKEKLAYVTATKFGYFLGSRSIIPSEHGNHTIIITLLEKNTVGNVQSGEKETISIPGGFSIDFEGEYVKSNGESYEGQVNVSIKHMPALLPETSSQMPGMLYGERENGTAGVLESYGMAAIEISAENGEELQIAGGSKATLHMPIDASQLANAPTTIPLWHFDETNGYWVEDGQARLIDGKYVGEVSHFSFWNCDDFYIDAILQGTVLGTNNLPLPYAQIEIITPNASTVGTANSYGYFNTYIPANQPITINIYNGCGNQLLTWTGGNYAANSVNSETFLVTSTIPNMTGTLLDCNNVPITNGYLTVEYVPSGVISFISTTNGIVNFPTIIGCQNQTSVIINGYDYTNLQTTGTLNFTITNPVTNLGNMVACTNLLEYINYTINNDSIFNFLTQLTCNTILDSSNNNIPIGIQVSGSGYGPFWLYLEGTTVGTYNFMDYNSSVPGAFLTIPHPINTNGGYPNIVFNLNNYGAVGSYVDITFSGSYTDYSSTTNTITGTIHVLRDS